MDTLSDDIILEGTVNNVRYQNNENGYTVFSILCGKEEITCTAYMEKLLEGETIKLTGVYIVHPSYGKQLSVKAYEKTIPTTIQGMERYLASGVIKGVGEKIAKKIVDKFGKDTLKVIEEYPEKLSTIKGITLAKALNISSIFHEQKELRVVMLYLQDFGITPAYAQKIYKKYRESTIDVVTTNPFRLADEIFGIGFKIADSIAFKVGIDEYSPYRIKAGLKYSLTQATLNGHVYLPKKILLENTQELLNIELEVIENALAELQIEKVIWQDKINNLEVVYLNLFFYAENFVAKKLLELSSNVISKSEGIDLVISNIEDEDNIILAENQKEAVREALSNGVLVITGGPGTGKTTTINTIIKILKQDGYEIELAAPTGRAAKRMSETTGMEAKTIHRLLGITFISEDTKKQFFDKNEENPIETDVIIIDESSMVDILLMNALLKAIEAGTRLILVGDVDQLPSVGPGNVLRDIINSECLNVVRLTEIFRQAQESAIVMNAHRINKGEYPILNEKNKDFFFVRRTSVETVCDTIIDLITTRLPSFIDCDKNKDIQVLTPMRKSPLGIYNLNKIIQEKVNPHSENKNEKETRGIIFREGDKVMQLKNNYNMTWQLIGKFGNIIDDGLGVFNGDEGIISEIDNESEVITVCFDENKYVDYDFTQLDELELSYAITIHKSQGSEYKIVIIPIHSGPPMLLSKNLLYTAVTRAKELAVIVGVEETLFRMVDNNREVSRYTSLNLRIRKINEFMK